MLSTGSLGLFTIGPIFVFALLGVEKIKVTQLLYLLGGKPQMPRLYQQGLGVWIKSVLGIF